jgi:predicted acyltransferase
MTPSRVRDFESPESEGERPTMSEPNATDEFTPSSNKPERLGSLDVFRGLTIAGMILVNNPGSWSAVYPPLRHAEWHGWTPTDLVFPFFLLIVGVAIPFSLGKRRESGSGWFGLVMKIVRRSLVIFAIGLALNGFPKYDWETIRIPGVLQRIAICYLVASLIDLAVGVRIKAGLVVVLLVGYWLAITLIPAPGHRAGDLSRVGNLAAAVDRAVLPGHLYKKDYDPEGLLSTIPALATTLIGILAGHWLRSGRSGYEKDAGLFVAGMFGVLLGWVWSAAFPINKALWTSSFVLLTAGLGFQGLAACYWLVDLKCIRGWSRPFAIFGTNAIAAYVLAAILARLIGMVEWKNASGQSVTLKGWIVGAIQGLGIAPTAASLTFALLFVAVCFVPVYLMHRNRIYLKA